MKAQNHRSPLAWVFVMLQASILVSCAGIEGSVIANSQTDVGIIARVSPTVFEGPTSIVYTYNSRYFPSKLAITLNPFGLEPRSGSPKELRVIGCGGPRIFLNEEALQQLNGRFYRATLTSDVSDTGMCDTRFLTINLKQIIRETGKLDTILQYVINYENGAFRLQFLPDQSQAIAFK